MNREFNLSSWRWTKYTRPQRQAAYLKLQPILDLNILSENVILCGGALQCLFNKDAKVNDFDLYFIPPNGGMVDEGWMLQYHPKDKLDILVNSTRNKLLDSGFKCVFECPEGKLYTYKKGKGRNCIKIQLIVEQVEGKIYPDVWEVINDFDLSCCVIACDGKKVYTFSECIRDIKRKKLSIWKLLHPVSTINRIGKYHYVKGYSYANVREQFLNALGVDPNAFDMRRYVD